MLTILSFHSKPSFKVHTTLINEDNVVSVDVYISLFIALYGWIHKLDLAMVCDPNEDH